MKLIKGNSKAPGAKVYDVPSDKPLSDFVEELAALEDLVEAGKLTIKRRATLDELAKLPLSDLSASERKAVLWYNNQSDD